MRHTRRVTLTAALAASAVIVGMAVFAGTPKEPRAAAAAAGPARKARKSADDLLKASGLFYKQLREGVYKVMIEGRGEVTPVLVIERKAPWKDNRGGEVRYIWVLSRVVDIPADFNPPPAMYRRIADLNDAYSFGNISLNKPAKGAGGIYRSFWLFLRAADSETLSDYCQLAHFDRLNLRKEFLPFLQEAKDDKP
jgi:hypothetical protein